MIVEKKPERSYSTTVMYLLAYLDRYGYPVLILIAGALADFYRGRITMLFVLAVGILLSLETYLSLLSEHVPYEDDTFAD